MGIRLIERLLLRHVSAPASGPSPEQRLIVAVICQAMVDARAGTGRERREGREYLHGRCLDLWAELIGLEPAFVREIAIKALYLPPLRDQAPHSTVSRDLLQGHAGLTSLTNVGGADAGFQF